MEDINIGKDTVIGTVITKGGDRIWMEELEMYYTFFYEIRNGRRVLGKDRVKKILDTIL